MGPDVAAARHRAAGTSLWSSGAAPRATSGQSIACHTACHSTDSWESTKMELDCLLQLWGIRPPRPHCGALGYSMQSSQNASYKKRSQMPKDIRCAPALAPITCKPKQGALHGLRPRRSAYERSPSCRPSGRLHVAVEMIWLQDKTPDLDALTDLSRLSMGPSVPSSSNMHYQVGLPYVVSQSWRELKYDAASIT